MDTDVTPESARPSVAAGNAARGRFASVRDTRMFRVGAAMLLLGALILVMAVISVQVVLLSALTGPGGVLVGILLLAGGGLAWAAPSRAGRLALWFRAFRRTRPFWGGAALLVGGWLVLRLSMVSAHIVVVSGLTGLGGWLTGGGMILCGLAAWSAPSQRYVVGIVGVILAVSSLIVSNLGGLFVGMIFGILGGAMTLAWGPKKPARPRGQRVFRLGAIGLAPQPATGAADSTTRLNRPRPAPGARPRPGNSAGRATDHDAPARA